jgi:hypothetical protein
MSLSVRRPNFFDEAPPGPGWRSHGVPTGGARPAPRAIRVIEEEFG